jgi:hypothetical protein
MSEAPQLTGWYSMSTPSSQIPTSSYDEDVTQVHAFPVKLAAHLLFAVGSRVRPDSREVLE